MARAKKIDCGGAKARYCRQRLASPKKFDAQSLRTIKRGVVLIVIGCPKGKWAKGKCKVGTRAASILYPYGHAKCRVCRKD